MEEEIVELKDILGKLNIPKSKIIFYVPVEFEYICFSEYQVVFYKKRSSLDFLDRMIELIYFQYVVYKFKPSIVYSGFPMLKYRLSSKIFKIKYITYIRTLLFDSDNYSGVGDYLRYGRFAFLFKSELFNTYEADKIMTVSQINKDFMIKRGVPDDKITLLPPVWLENLQSLHTKHETTKITTIIFLTQAFTSHGFPELAKSQIIFLKKLITYCLRHDYALIIRKHPRDLHDYKSYLMPKINIDTSKPEVFLSRLDVNSIIISPLSTFAFEAMHLNMNVVFYSTSELDKVYLKRYIDLNIKPIYDLDENLIHEKINYKDIFYKSNNLKQR